jgi:hypothetical protein
MALDLLDHIQSLTLGIDWTNSITVHGECHVTNNHTVKELNDQLNTCLGWVTKALAEDGELARREDTDPVIRIQRDLLRLRFEAKANGVGFRSRSDVDLTTAIERGFE